VIEGGGIPSHVPPGLVRDFSFWSAPGMAPTPNGDPQAALSVLHSGPPIFYAPNNTLDGHGTWVVTRAEDQRRVLQDAETFSSHRRIFSSKLGEDWPLVPLELDPPEHAPFRRLLNPLFGPARMNAMEAGARARAARMIEALKPAGSCDVMEDFAFPFAVGIFLQFLGLPEERGGEFLRWAKGLLHGAEPAVRAAAARAIIAYLKELADHRRREPGEDFMTFVVQAQVNGRPLTDEEIRGMSVLIFVAGLDTVAAAIGFDLSHLARRPEDQSRLRADPSLIRNAVEELLRAYPTVQMIRVARRDVELHGVQIKAGDYVSCATMIANRDPLEFPDPDRIDLARENNRHVAFAYGPHRCIGSHLARRELVIALEEWLARLPPFRIKPDTAPVTFGGHVFGISRLVLDWSAGAVP
jgi:cytochrome P450